MPNNEEIVRDFINAWSRLDVAELTAYFTEDGVYHNMPSSPVSGQTQVRALIGAFLRNWTATEWEIINIISSGDIVIAERLDRTKMGGKSIDLPCCGVFEMSGGKIKVWRDYFDMATYTKAIAG
jgi:limonene-1,2-epoxide hydrolase